MKVRHTQVEAWMVEMVQRRLSDFGYRGKLDRQHYSFVKTAVVAPFPVYHHLIFCYNRTARRLQARVACSLLPKWQLKRNLGRISHLSTMVSCDLSGHSRFVKSREIFEGNIQDLLSVFLPDHTQQLTNDSYLAEALLQFHREGGLNREDHWPKFISDLTLVVKQHSLGDDVEPEKEANDALDAFLSDLVPKNAEISAGSFSLNAKHASRKLQEFQLSSPQNFVVHLIGGAIAGGATQVDIYVDSDDIVVSFDGSPITRGELVDLEESLLHSEGSPRSRELNVALNAAISLEPRWLFIETWHGGAGWKFHFGRQQEPQALANSPFRAPGREGHRIHFRDKARVEVVLRFLNSLRREHPELDVIRDRCHLAPVPLVYEDSDLRSVPWDEAAAYFIVEDPEQPLGFTPPDNLQGLRDETKSGYSALLLLGPKPQLELRVNGVLYEAPTRHQDFPLWCLVTNNNFNRDLSYTGVKDGDKFSALMIELGKHEKRFRNFLTKRLGVLGPMPKQTAAAYLRDRLTEGDRDLREQPIFATLDDQYFSLPVLQQSPNLHFTEKEWKHPLRSGVPVFKLSGKHRDCLRAQLGDQCPRLNSADTELALSQTYFEYLQEWMSKPTVTQVEVSRSFGPTQSIKGLAGQFSLLPQTESCLLEAYAMMRPLTKVRLTGFPKGLRIACNWDSLEMSMRWNRIEENEEWEELLAELRSDLEAYYGRLFGHSGRYTTYLLHYLIWKKKNGRKWKHQAPKLQFRLRDGSTRSWSELHEEGSQLVSFESLWLKTVHVKLEQKQLMQQLLS